MRRRILAVSLAIVLISFTLTGVVSAAGTVTNTGVVGYPPSISGSIIAFRTYEGDIGLDLNGDGDTGDNVIRYYDIETGITTSTGALGIQVSAGGSILALETYEGDIGDSNGDGDAYDIVIRYYDTATGTLTNIGAAGYVPSAGSSLIAFFTYEGSAGKDLNGDGDKSDYIIRYYDTATHTLTNTGLLGEYPSVSGSTIAFQTSEYYTGQDMNGDGDTNDVIIRYYDTLTGTVTNTEVVGYAASVSGSIIAFQTNESSIGQDLDGDGDTTDTVIRYYDTATGNLTNTGAAGSYPSATGPIIAFQTPEYATGYDLNGDGDTFDIIMRYYDIATDTVASTGAIGEYPSASGSNIAFHTWEGFVGEDLNGDGFLNDNVVRYYTILNAATIESIQELLDAFVADGSIDSQGIAQPLYELLEQAQANIARGNLTAAVNTLDAFTRFVNSQADKHITPEAAQTLADAVQEFINGLQ